jgi:hypothetical protein
MQKKGAWGGPSEASRGGAELQRVVLRVEASEGGDRIAQRASPSLPL